MNKQRRREIIEAIRKIERIVSSILAEEEEAFDNMPEGLQESDNGIVSQEAQENLGEAVSSLYEVITLLNNGSVNDDTIDAIIDAIIYMEDSV